MNTFKRLRGTLIVVVAVMLAANAGIASADKLGEQTEVIMEGTGWKLLDTDPATSKGGADNLVWMVSAEGVANLPVSQAQKDMLTEAFTDDPEAGRNDVIYAVKTLYEAMEDPSFPAGYERYIEPDEGKSESLSFSVCSWSTDQKTRDWSFSQSLLNRSFQFTSGVSGSFNLDLPITGQAHIEATYKIHKCFGVPVGFKFVSASASGNASAGGTASLDATVSVTAHYEKEWKLAEPELGTISFTIAYIPVRLVFTLPIYAGASFDAAFSATLAANASLTGSGSFNYTCTPDDCTGTNTFNDELDFTGPTASAQADLKAKAFARVMVRCSLYSSSIAYVEGGLKAYAKAGIWGYYGNTCGDADGNGTNETVQALVGDLSWGYEVPYGIGGWLLPDRQWTATSHEYPIGWRDFLGTGGSTALQPMLLGPSTVTQGQNASYTVKMRPCYPYHDAVTFTMAPGTWSGVAPITPPSGSATVSRSFSSPGGVTLTATATGDAFGRGLNQPYSRSITVSTTVPAAPSGLTATALSSTSVRLDWSDNSNNETAFEVQRRLSPSGSWGTIATTGANAVTLTDNSVQAATAYDYRVRATNAGGASGYSNIVTVTTPQGAPAAPSGLVAWTEIANQRIHLTWVDNSNNEQGFNVQFSYSGSAFSDLYPPTVGANVTNYVTGANPPTGSYQFRVRAYNGSLSSAWSNVASMIFVTPVAGYQGCYTDSTPRALPVQIAGSTYTVESCKQAAFNAGYRYAGLQYGGQCFAGNSLGYTLVTDVECNMPCTANGLEMCGAGWHNSIYATGYVPSASASIAWIQPAEVCWGTPGTLTAAGYASNGTGGVQLVFRERNDAGVWGSWQTVAFQATPGPDTTWSNSISSGSPTNKCHFFDAYVSYSGVTSPTFHYTGWTGCP